MRGPVADLRAGATPLRVPVTDPGRVEVHDGPAQVRLERAMRPQVCEPSDATNEGFVREVVRSVAIAGQQERQPDPAGDVPSVELGHRAGLRLRPRSVFHDRPFTHHVSYDA